MESNKDMIPKLPTSQNVLEDIADPDVLQLDEELKVTKPEDVLNDGYACYRNINQLKKDIKKQNDLNAKLEDLNKELVHNIENMKKQK